MAGRSNDPEIHLAAGWMCFFHTVPDENKEFVSLIRNELYGIDYTNPSIHDRKLMGYVMYGKNRHLALGIIHVIIGHIIYFCKIHKMPVLVDYLNEYNEYRLRDEIVAFNDAENTSKFALNIRQESVISRYLIVFQLADWHIEVLRRTGLSLRGVGLYDILAERYEDYINPELIDRAKELEEWLEEEEARPFTNKLGHMKKLRDKIDEIETRGGWRFDEKEVVVEYIAREVMGWIK